jgi:hypothetical protein
MTDNDLEGFEQAMLVLNETFGDSNKPLSDLKMKLYFEALKDLTIEQLHNAVLVLANTKTMHIFPTPAEIREAIKGNAQDQAMIALGQLKHAMETIGGYKSVSFEDKTIMAVVQAMGGWTKLCETPYDEWKWLEKDFVKIYQAYSVRDVPAPEKLTGIVDHQNQLYGYTEERLKELGMEPPKAVTVGETEIDRGMPRLKMVRGER